jgi:hypothetical protein
VPANPQEEDSFGPFEGDLAVSMALPETVETIRSTSKKAASSSTQAVVEIIK